jgi:hypothetical protein
MTPASLPTGRLAFQVAYIQQDWCRNYLSPFSQHSLTPQHSEQRSQGAGSCGTPSCASAAKSSPGQRGSSCGRSRGDTTPLCSPMHVALSLPSSQESVVFFCQSITIVYVPISPPPPWGGGEGTRPCLLHFFYLGTVPDKITSVCSVFHC